MRARRWWLLPGVLLLLALPAGAGAASDTWVTPFRGYLGVGWSGLQQNAAPSGSIAMAAGIDYPVTATLRAGVEFGYDLLGTRTVENGSLVADLDYAALEVLALLHWQPSWRGPVGRLSVGPGLVAARVAQSSSGAAAFEQFTVDEVAPALAGSVTLISRHPRPVRVGFEAGTRVAFFSNPASVIPAEGASFDGWFLLNARLVIHY